MLIWASRELLFYVVPSFGGILGLSATQGVSDDTLFFDLVYACIYLDVLRFELFLGLSFLQNFCCRLTVK